MRTVFFVLLAANLAAGAWLWTQGPVDVLRETGRASEQINAGGFRLLTDAEVAQRRSEAERKAAASSSAAAAAAAAANAMAAAGVDLPLASCIDIGTFSTEAATKKLRTRLAAAGLGERTAVATIDRTVHVRLTGIDAAAEVQVHAILKDFPRQDMSHCSEAPPAR